MFTMLRGTNKLPQPTVWLEDTSPCNLDWSGYSTRPLISVAWLDPGYLLVGAAGRQRSYLGTSIPLPPKAAGGRLRRHGCICHWIGTVQEPKP
ncbi:hypothetical protein DSO57_1028603 [Entomophthora muscae]|uniref:Uncharacterized protein n=1 Tax=Entomophthora muscae TaxID=34485 RepID=A0ACC2SET0_9FUNG|nr:hypothetical protein DSO57_1028603 [Entomophthora muscae]